jgi:hypothetical protein
LGPQICETPFRVRGRRGAFTLVEILVAMALTLFVMVILSQAFIAGLDVFSGLKSIGDMQEQLRTAKQLLLDDLALDHFEGKRRLSDPTMNASPFNAQNRIREGFFRVVQEEASYPEGPALPPPQIPVDSYGLPSYRAGMTGDKHYLHFTVKQRGNRRDKFFSALIPANSPLATLASSLMQNPGIENDANMRESPLIYKSPWAEVAWFLVPQGTTIEQNNPTGVGAPMYKLYRSQFVIPPDTRGEDKNSNGVLDPGEDTNSNGVLDLFATSPPPPGETGQDNIACVDAPSPYYRSPTDMADHPSLRVWDEQNVNNKKLRGATLVLSNVLNFHIQVLKTPGAIAFEDINEDKNLNGVLDPGEDINGNGILDVAYDTWYPPPQAPPPVPPAMNPTTYPIHAIRISIRVWDSKTQQTRQVTFIQDL